MLRGARKILITSQKGGVGKSTLSVNLVAFFRQILGRRTALVDLDRQATASKWFRGAEEACINDALYQLDVGASHGITALNASRLIRSAAQLNDIVVTDLTWNDILPKEFFYEFDLLIVPCSLSSVEIDSTMDFLERFAHVLSSSSRTPPKLVIAPSRIRQMEDYEVMLSRIFKLEFFLAPPVNYSPSTQDYFGNTFIFNSPDPEIRQNFSDFARSVHDLLNHIESQSAHSRRPTLAVGHRDAGSALDRFMLVRMANRKSNTRDRLGDKTNANEDQFLPSFLRSVSNRIRT